MSNEDQRETSKKCVRFSDLVRVRRTRRLADYFEHNAVEDPKSFLWYSSDELNDVRYRDYQILELMDQQFHDDEDEHDLDDDALNRTILSGNNTSSSLGLAAGLRSGVGGNPNEEVLLAGDAETLRAGACLVRGMPNELAELVVLAGDPAETLRAGACLARPTRKSKVTSVSR